MITSSILTNCLSRKIY